MRRPLVGIEVDLDVSPSGQRFANCGEAYFDAVSDAGGTPVLVPPASQTIQHHQLNALSALVVPGGADFHASEWGATQRSDASYLPSDARRLAASRALLREADKRSLPLLGICYGMQLLCLVRGGSLIQDLGVEHPAPLDHRACHNVEVRVDTLLSRICAGPGQFRVNSHHHQAVRAPGSSLVISSQASDGVIEAIEDPTPSRFALGVQWHPEELGDICVGRGLFEALVDAATPNQ